MGFKFFGLVESKVPSTNEIWAFTPGMLDDRGWLSEKTGGGDMGLFKMVKEGVENSKHMLLAVPFRGARTKDFEGLLKEGQKTDVLRIRLFDPHLKKYPMNILLIQVKAGPILPSSDGNHDGPHAYKLCSFRVKGADFEAP